MALRTDSIRFRGLSPVASLARAGGAVPLALVLMLVACGGSNSKYKIPVDAPEYKPFEVPEDDAFEEEADWDEGDDDDDDGGDGDGDGDADGGAAPAPTGTTNGGGAPKPTAGGAVKPELKLGNSTVTGSLDKNIIRRYVRRKSPQVRNCYERELLTNPNLAGKVSVTFTITPTGSVTDVAASGMAVVDACVGKAIKSLVFPKPKSGGTVRVRYPFVFSSTK